MLTWKPEKPLGDVLGYSTNFYKLVEAMPKPGYNSEQAGKCASCGSNVGETVDTAELLDRIGGDRDLLNQLIEIFLQDDKSLEGIREAVGRGDPEALNKSAHRLKGSLGTFAAHAAFEFAQELERIGISGVMSGAQEVLLELENEIARVKEALESLVKCEV